MVSFSQILKVSLMEIEAATKTSNVTVEIWQSVVISAEIVKKLNPPQSVISMVFEPTSE